MLGINENTKWVSAAGVIIVCVMLVGVAAADWPQHDKLMPSDGVAEDYFGRSVSISGDYAIVGSELDREGDEHQTGSAYIFKRIGQSWVEHAKLVSPDAGDADDWFGRSVSISGDYAIVGADCDDFAGGSKPGAAYIFKRNDQIWGQYAKLTASDAAIGDQFGWSVSIAGDYAIVGARFEDAQGTNAGAAYIFKHVGESWLEQDKLVAAESDVDDWFGWSVSMDGDYVVIGAYRDEVEGGDAGAAYIFKRDDGLETWAQKARLTPSVHETDDCFGWSVSISDDYAVIGAYGNDDRGPLTGSAYIFKRDDGLETWAQQEQLVPSDIDADSYFGWSVCISGDYAIVGNGKEQISGSFGSASIFKRDDGLETWTEEIKLTPSDASSYGKFGWSVAISQKDAIVGAICDDDGSGAGSVYVFSEDALAGDPDGSGCVDQNDLGMLIEEWLKYNTEHVKLNSFDGAIGDWFGHAVAVNGDYAIMGAQGDDDNGVDSGSAYIFKYEGENWTQKAKLTASDGVPGDSFGISVSISGEYAIVGAHHDDDKGASSGSAYIFKRNAGLETWSEKAKLTASDGAADDYFGWSVSICGDHAIAGAPGKINIAAPVNPGAAYTFKRDAGLETWSEKAKLTAYDGDAGDLFGWSVSVNWGRAIVGAPHDSGVELLHGAAYPFFFNGITWQSQAKLTGELSGGAHFGVSAAISADYAIIGASGDCVAYIFKNDVINWSEQAEVTVSDIENDDAFGWSVSIYGDYAIVGNYWDDDNGNNSGSAHLFKRSGTNWIQKTSKLLSTDGVAGDEFGCSVAMGENYAIFGAHGDDDKGSDSGSAYVFRDMCPDADLTGDCFVDLYDFSVLAEKWMECSE